MVQWVRIVVFLAIFFLSWCSIHSLSCLALVFFCSMFPSTIYPLNPFLYLQSRGEAGAYSICHNHPQSHSLLGRILDSSINLTCVVLGSGSMAENPERTHTYTGRTSKLRTERPQLRIEPRTLLPWGTGANHYITVWPIRFLVLANRWEPWEHQRSLRFYMIIICYQKLLV